jgi:hypothetical protein
VLVLKALGAEETQIEASFCAAISIAKEQKAVLLQNAQKRPTQNTVAAHQSQASEFSKVFVKSA